MASIEVDVRGLSVLAGHHEQQAALLAAIAAPVETPAIRGGMPGGIVGGVLPDNESLPLAHVDQVAAQAVAGRQDLVLSTIRSMISDGLMEVGAIVGGSDERVEPWDLSLDDAMARIHEEYVVHHDDQNWVFGTWFALTERGQQAAKALETTKSEG